MTDKNKWISDKIKLIMQEGIRGRPVKQNQAIAVALAMYRKRKKK